MKPGGIDWIGDIPAEWKINRLGFLFTFGKGLNITKEDLQDMGIPCVSYGEIHSKYGFEVNPEKDILRYVDEKYLRTERKSLLKYGDFLFADTSEDLEGSGNFTYLNSNEKVFAGYHTIILRARENINHRYIAYMFDSISFRTQIRNNVWGIKVYSITQPILKNAKIILPSPKEQQAIAVFLDAQCNRIDNIITEMEQQIEVLKQYKTSLITETVTKGLDKSAPLKDSGIDWIGKIPVHWEMGRIKYCYDILLGKMLQPFQERNADKKMSYMCSANITWDGIDLSVLKQMWFSPEEIKNYLLKKGDLLVAEGGDVALASIWNNEVEDCCIQNALHLVRENERHSNKFLYYWLYFLKHTGYIDLICNKATIAHFTKEKFGESSICVMPLEEQKSIAAFLDTQCSHIENIIADKLQSVEAMKAYKKSLIYEYVTGKKRVKGINDTVL
jgi:type I restriction enzyme S subunit